MQVHMFPLKVVFLVVEKKSHFLPLLTKSAVKMKSKSFSAHRQEQLLCWEMLPSVMLITF